MASRALILIAIMSLIGLPSSLTLDEDINRFELEYIKDNNLNEAERLVYFGDLQEARSTDLINEITNWIFPTRLDDFYCRRRHDRVPYPPDCRRFYLCMSYKAYLAECPPMFYFDWTTEKCVFSYLAYCYEPINETFDCPERNENYRHAKCDRYWLCSNGKAIQRRCGLRRFFSEKARECIWRYDANCVEGGNITMVKHATSKPSCSLAF